MTDQLFSEDEVTTESDPIETIKSKFTKDDKLDVDALIAAKAESDRFIEQLKSEGKGIREELAKRISVEEALAKIQATADSKAQSVNHAEPRPKNDDVQNTVTADDVRKMVTDTLQTETQKATHVKNRQSVKAELQKTWGDDYVKHLRVVIGDLDLTPQEADLLAATKPKAFLKLVIDQHTTEHPSMFAAPKSNVQTNPDMKNVGKKNYAYFKQMLDSPDSKIRQKYWSPAVQNEMHKLAISQGEAFFN